MTPSRIITTICAGIVAFYALVMASQVGKPKGWPVDDKGVVVQTDYIALWAAGRLALEGKPAAVYDWDRHADAMAEGLGRKPAAFPFPYPPPFLAVVAPLALAPYIPSLLLFATLTLALYVFACARITGRWEGAIWLAAPIVTMANFNVGQNGFLTAALLGGGLLLLPARPVLAGVLIGALSIKPHLGMLLPFALAAAGCWRAFASAALTVAALALVSLGLFGLAPWQAFIANLGTFGASVASDQYHVPFKLQSVYGLLHTLGMPRAAALAVQAMLALGLVALTVIVWRSRAAHDLKAAMLAAAAVLVSPYVFIYDLTFLGIAQAFLIRHWLATRLEQWDVIALFAINTVIVLFVAVKLPTGVLASLMLLAMAVRLAAPRLALPWQRPSAGLTQA